MLDNHFLTIENWVMMSSIFGSSTNLRHLVRIFKSCPLFFLCHTPFSSGINVTIKPSVLSPKRWPRGCALAAVYNP